MWCTLIQSDKFHEETSPKRYRVGISLVKLETQRRRYFLMGTVYCYHKRRFHMIKLSLIFVCAGYLDRVVMLFGGICPNTCYLTDPFLSSSRKWNMLTGCTMFGMLSNYTHEENQMESFSEYCRIPNVNGRESICIMQNISIWTFLLCQVYGTWLYLGAWFLCFVLGWYQSYVCK